VKPVTIDPRYHDAVLFDLDLLDEAAPAFESTVDLLRELKAAGLATAICSSSRDCQRVLQAADNSPTTVLVIPTNEEVAITRGCVQVIDA